MTTWIRGGTIVTEQETFPGDLLIGDGRIRQILPRGKDAQAPSADAPTPVADEIIEAAGRYVLPGAVDIHTHMDLDVGFARAIDDFSSGTVAAACGGTTAIVDHMAFGPAGCSPWRQVEEYHRLADGKAAVDYGFHGVLQHLNEEVLSALPRIADQEGITSFKAYLTYDFRLDDLSLMRVLQTAREAGLLIAAHCENHGIVTYWRERFVQEGKTQARFHPASRPPEAEAEAVHRLLSLARAAGEAPVYIVHLSSRLGLEEVRRARAAGQRHFGAETCPQYLLLDESLYEDPREGLKAIMSPPVRRKEDRDALWSALTAGELDTVATDHCPFTFAEQKQRGAADFTRCPNGAPGVEERLILLYSEGVAKGRLSLQQLVAYACANPARVAGIYPQKGVIAPGADADLVLLNPEKTWTLTTAQLHGKADYTCYEGWPVQGAIERVLLRGKTVAQDGRFTGKADGGQYLRRGRSSLA